MRRTGFVLAAALLILSACGETEIIDLPRGKAVPELNQAIDSFYAATQAVKAPNHITLHSIMVVRNGKVIAEQWFNGESADKPHVMHSVSKTFTASAVGLAIDEGKLALTDKVISFFPEELPETVSDNLAAMTVRDLLTMTCGHNSEPSRGFSPNADWVRNFLAHPVEHVPGEYYLYNSMGTYMLSAIVQKVTGQKVLDYLDERLFQPLHIERPRWDESPQGISCGGWGLYIKTEDMAKMGQLLLQKGKWNGKQVLPAEWVAEMSKYQVPSAPSGTPIERMAELGVTKDNNDWAQGYGYQMWITRHGAYRADGANGQYIIIFPDRNEVLVLTTNSNLYQPYLDLVWKYLLPAL